MSNIVKEFFEFMAYLEANDLALDKEGNIVKKEEKGKGPVLRKSEK